MDTALNIAQSGLNAAATLLQVAAENEVNSQSAGYTTRQVELVEQIGGGVAVAAITPDAQGGDGVDPVAQAIEFRRAQTLYDANAQVIATQEQMFGSLINILDNQPPPQLPQTTS